MPTFEPIVPKRKQLIDAGSVRSKLEARMRTLVADLHRTAATYEPPPSPRYRRTLTLKRSWNHRTIWQGINLIGEVTSSGAMAPYNIYVRGPKVGARHQAARMAARGWMSVTEIMNKEWPKARRDFQKILGSAS